LGNTDIRDALVGLESLVQEEDRMTGAQTLKSTVKVKDKLDSVGHGKQSLANGHPLRTECLTGQVSNK
jgi:hypothetical protein